MAGNDWKLVVVDAYAEIGATAPTIPLVDSHHHLWDLDRFQYNWLSAAAQDDLTDELGDYAAIRKNFLIGDLLAEYRTAGIVKSIHVQADISEPDPVVETSWLQGIADAHGFPHGIIAFVDLRSSSLEDELDRHHQHANLRGIRMPDDAALMADPAVRRCAAALVKRGLSLEVDAQPARMGLVARLAHDVPDLRLFLGHTGSPFHLSKVGFKNWRASVRNVARAENVVVKISGLGMRDHGWTTESIRPWVLEAIDAFGVDRCVFGTNWPVDRLYSDLGTLVSAYRTLVSDFTRSEQEALLFRNAERLYSI